MNQARAAMLMALALPATGCVAAGPAPTPPAALPPAIPDVPAPPLPVLTGASALRLEGRPEQGTLLHGHVRPGTTLTLDDTPVTVAPDGAFVIGFDRDAPATATLTERFAGPAGNPLVAVTRLPVAPRAWRLEQVDAPYRAGRTSEAFAALRPAELAQIAAARRMVTDAAGWRQRFVWPAHGRQSGWFGAQRVYQGKPGSYHSGADIAVPTGTPVLAPADGVVILATPAPFTLEGNLLLIDHGAGLSSALMHLSRIDVPVGAHVRQGQPIALSGATGRATGPHLHWGVTWRGARLDPLLVVGAGPT